MLGALIMLVAASLLASGILFAHQRWVTFLATAGVLLEGEWLLLTLLDRTLLKVFSTATVFTAGSVVLFLLWAARYRAWTRPQLMWRRELPVLLILVAVLGSAGLVVSRNGYLNGDFVTHGFYNGDTATFISLVQVSLLTDALVDTNPFAGGGSLEYPTLLHGAFATLVSALGFGMAWLHLLPLLTLLQAAVTVPMLFLLWDLTYGEPAASWQKWLGASKRAWITVAQAGIAAYVLLLSWDTYIYPQSHFFLTGLFLLLIGLLVRGFGERHWREYVWVATAAVAALLLLLTNAVTGTAAVAVTIVFYLLRAADKGRPIWQRVDYLIGVVVWLVLFMLSAPGAPAFGLAYLSYTAVPAMLRLSPVLLALAVAMWLTLDRHKYLEVAAATLMLLALTTFFGSTRNIVVENAERFFYHAVLVAFPLLLGPAIQLFYYLRRRLLFTTLSPGQAATGWATVIVAAALFALQPLASFASVHDALLRQDRQVVTASEQAALAWLAAHAVPEAVVLAAPDAPFSVPMFTGRALLRANYWLDPADELTEVVNRAFSGDAAAQKQALQAADYLLLTSGQASAWELKNYEPVFTNSDISIYHVQRDAGL